ncbi:uncharacterized protein LOC109790256, partial [Cajanus cajan]|uniref:uncharacterized protein LOC109790256 n=1 Tax=Cajanus cajan TaxID=3821 RepID=UPI00098D885F
MANLNPLMDPLNPYHVPNGDNAIISIVPIVLKGNNYHAWSRAMTMALTSKSKMEFINGSLSKPDVGDALLPAWKKCNNMVLSWIINSLDPEIIQSVLWIDIAKDLWDDLRDRYYQGDVFRISELQEAVYALRQGELSVTAYFTQLKGLWQELENFRPIPSCTCANQCNCKLIPTMKAYIEGDYVIRFLKGLNEQYFVVRSQIMLMDPLPTMSKVFSLLVQQERQMNIINGGQHVLTAYSGTNGRGNFKERNFKDNNFQSAGRGRGRGQGGKNQKVCSFCGKNGHTVDTCYKKHGYPPHLKKNYAINNYVAEHDDDADDRQNMMSQREMGEGSSLEFTPDQHKALLDQPIENKFDIVK